MTHPMISTIDNPFDPFTQFEDWSQFDRSQGYYTSEYLARIVKTSDEISDEDYEIALDNAIDEILFFDVTGNYRLVYENDETFSKNK